jgi:hypothetical protein
MEKLAEDNTGDKIVPFPGYQLIQILLSTVQLIVQRKCSMHNVCDFHLKCLNKS